MVHIHVYVCAYYFLCAFKRWPTQLPKPTTVRLRQSVVVCVHTYIIKVLISTFLGVWHERSYHDVNGGYWEIRIHTHTWAVWSAHYDSTNIHSYMYTLFIHTHTHSLHKHGHTHTCMHTHTHTHTHTHLFVCPWPPFIIRLPYDHLHSSLDR